MKILMVNKFHYVRGGSERYAFELSDLLRRHGHQVVPFSTEDPRNLPADDDAVFVPGVEFDRRIGFFEGLRLGTQVIYSRVARRAMATALERLQPDVVHLHNIAHHFSPSILLEIGRRGVPVVQTLHDFKLVCPTYRLLCRGEICERCAGGHYSHVLRQRCNRDSWSRSAASAVESYLHAWLGSYDRIDRFLCPSLFLTDKVAACGVDPARLVHLPLFVDAARVVAEPRPGPYVIFVGRLSPEKGVHTLLAAARRTPGVEYRIVGDGPDQAAIAAEVEAGGLGHVRLLGRLDGDALQTEWRGAAMTVVPSEWFENFPLTVVESMALGKPVIASRLGGLIDMVNDGATGRLFTPGAVDELAAVITELTGDPDRLTAMGTAARAHVERDLTPERHYAGVIETYAAAGARVES